MFRHSAGSLTAVEAYFEAPDRVAALILVAPAIIAPLSATKENKSDKENQAQKSSDEPQNLLSKLGQVLSKFYRYIANTIMHVLKGIMNVVSFVYTKAIVAILRSAIAKIFVSFSSAHNYYYINLVLSLCRYFMLKDICEVRIVS